MVQLTRTVFHSWSLGYISIKNMGCFFFFFWPSHVTYQTILQCFKPPVGFHIDSLKCVLIKNDLEREWYIIPQSCRAGQQIPSARREEGLVGGEEACCFLVRSDASRAEHQKQLRSWVSVKCRESECKSWGWRGLLGADHRVLTSSCGWCRAREGFIF